MSKKVLSLLLICILTLSLASCGGNEITLNLSFGERTGTYSGDMTDGVPNGQGKFTTKNSDGQEWTYEGEFKNGHFEGEGKTTWENGQMEIGTYKNDVIVPMSGDEIKGLFSNPENLKNHYVEIIGKVFTAPEYTDDGICIQMFADYENSENNTVVYIADTDFKVDAGDYIKVIGKVSEPVTGTNVLGAEITAPTVIAKEYSILSYQEAASPTNKTIEVNKTQTQLGYSVTVQKVELAENETRVYIKVENHGSDNFNVYSFNAKLTQNGKQYEEQSNWDADYPEIQTDLLVGNSTEGIIAFPAIKEGAFKLLIEGSSDNWEEDIKPFTFNIVG